MREKALSEEMLSRIVESLLAALPVESIYLFGSYAKGLQSPESDVDIYVVTSDDETSRFELMGRAGASLLWMDVPKDVLVGTADRFSSRRDSLADIEYVVAREGVKIFDRAA